MQLNFLLCNLKSHVQLCLAGDRWELPMGHSWPISFWHICGKPSWVRTVLVSRDLNSSLSLLLCDLQQNRMVIDHLIRLTDRTEPIVFSFSSHMLCSFTSVFYWVTVFATIPYSSSAWEDLTLPRWPRLTGFPLCMRFYEAGVGPSQMDSDFPLFWLLFYYPLVNNKLIIPEYYKPQSQNPLVFLL